MLGGRFKATKIDADAAPTVKKSMGLTSLFHANTAQIPKKREPEKESPSEEKEAPQDPNT